MSEYVGVKGWYSGDIVGELKRAALVFDKLIIKHVHGEGVCDEFPHVKADLKYLLDRDVLQKPPDLTYDTQRYPWLMDYDELLITNPSSMWKMLVLGNLGKPEATRWRETKAQTYLASADAYARVASRMLGSDATPACPLLNRPPAAHPSLPTRKSEILQLVYDNLPMPDETTDWESILDWRNDPEAKRKFADLRTWVIANSKSSLSIPEIQDYLEAAILNYKTYMAPHYKKFRRGRFIALLIAGTKMIEELPKIKISPLLETAFDADKRQVELTKEELNAPHNDIAYIAGAQERFQT